MKIISNLENQVNYFSLLWDGCNPECRKNVMSLCLSLYAEWKPVSLYNSAGAQRHQKSAFASAFPLLSRGFLITRCQEPRFRSPVPFPPFHVHRRFGREACGGQCCAAGGFLPGEL